MPPSVTLVVAMRNEAASIEACLASLLAQDYPSDRLEVLVLDGGSTDGSRAIADRLVAGRPGWAVHDNPRIIQAAAWNRGIEGATGDIVGIVSGHAELAPDYVSRAVECLERTGADMVGGPVRALPTGPMSEAIGAATSSPFGVGGARHHYLTEEADVDTVFMGVCRRSTYRAFPFDEEMVRNQDDELSYRLLDAGGRIVCDPAIRSSYRNSSDLPRLFRQYHDYGLWKVRVAQKHPGQLRLRHVVPAAFVGSMSGGLLGWPMSRHIRRLTLLAGLAYVAGLIGATLRTSVGHRPAMKARIAAAYVTLHVAYGSGFLRGLWRFRGRWTSRGTSETRGRTD